MKELVSRSAWSRLEQHIVGVFPPNYCQADRSGSLRRATAVWPILGALWLVAFFTSAEPALGQELEPRVYSASPIDTNFVVGTLSNSTGNVSLDPSLPLSDVHASVNTAGLSFTRTFALVGHTATWAVLVPYLGGRISGAVYGQPQATTRNGFPDLRLRFAMNVLGRALTPVEFARRKPSTTLGVGFIVIAPTGTYDPSRLINIGSNRWSIKPEIGVDVPMGNWFVDFSGGVWLFGANTGYLGRQTLQQAPLANYQIHAGYNFRPSQWLALDWGYLGGGGVTVGAAPPINALSSARYGAAFSQPLGTGLSAKVLWSHWLSGQPALSESLRQPSCPRTEAQRLFAPAAGANVEMPGADMLWWRNVGTFTDRFGIGMDDSIAGSNGRFYSIK